MNQFSFVDELTRRLGEALPPGVSQAREDLESTFRSVLNNAFERVDLLLERLQAKLSDLEGQLAELQNDGPSAD